MFQLYKNGLTDCPTSHLSQTKTLDDDVTLCAWEPAVDVYEADGAIVFKAKLTGVRKEVVSVEIKDNVLTLKGERCIDPEIDEEKYLS